VRQEEKKVGEKRKPCHGDTDSSHEAQSSSKKTRLDDYFVKKAAEEKVSSVTVKEDYHTGIVTGDCTCFQVVFT